MNFLMWFGEIKISVTEFSNIFTSENIADIVCEIIKKVTLLMKIDNMYKNQYILNDYMDLLNKYNLHFLEEGREDAIIKSKQFYFVESVLDMLISFDLIPTSVFPTHNQSVQLNYEDKYDMDKYLEVEIFSDLSTKFWIPKKSYNKGEYTPEQILDTIEKLTEGWKIVCER